MPKLWTATIDTHRRTVREAILDAAWTLVKSRGPLAVRMSEVAEEAGIGRATLYKYFPDVESILVAWHHRHVAAHLEQLAALRDGPGDAGSRLRAVLDAYASICQQRERHGTDVAVLLHRGGEAGRAEEHVVALIRDLVAEAARDGQARDDVEPDELAQYAIHALAAAGRLQDGDAVRRLVDVTWAGIRAGS
jgi:AcrR family transcriptional regulator